MNLADLKKPFPPESVHWRVGSTNKDKTMALALAYIDARDVMDRLDEVCGADGWDCSYDVADKRVICTIGIYFYWMDGETKKDERWVRKSDGAGDTAIEGEKGGISDALKRAAVVWGIGRYLYRLPNVWVEIEPMGKSFRIKQSERQKLDNVLKNHKSPQPKQPEIDSKTPSGPASPPKEPTPMPAIDKDMKRAQEVADNFFSCYEAQKPIEDYWKKEGHAIYQAAQQDNEEEAMVIWQIKEHWKAEIAKEAK